jgi:methylmalonyl-CoA mutase cobalamin-binding domain/chain
MIRRVIMKDDRYADVQKAIIELDEDKLNKLTEEIISSKIDPVDALQNAYAPGIRKVGSLFESGEYFLPELVNAANIVKDAVQKLESHIPSGKSFRRGKVAIGTVEGDIHDLGKNLVCTMLSAGGFDVVDLGVDCPADRFIDRALEEKVQIIGASCLLTMTAPKLEELVQRLKERNLRSRFKVMVGGAAVDKAWAKEIGADGFGADLIEAVQVASSLINKLEVN